MLAATAIPTIAGTLLSLSIQESPKFLLTKRKDKEAAEKSLLFYQGNDNILNIILRNFECDKFSKILA